MTLFGVTFEWSVSLGSMIHLGTLIAFLWWLHRRGFEKLNKIHQNTNEILKSLPNTTTK